MDSENATDPGTGRDFFLDVPDDLTDGEDVVFILNLHGGGSAGAWQRRYFPAIDFKEKYRLVVATPTAATTQPFRMWTPEADDEHLRNVVELVFDKVGQRHVESFWLAGHSQGGMTSNRLLCTPFFGDRVDGWLSLSGGRIGPITLPDSFFAGRPRTLPRFPAINGEMPRPGAAVPPTADISFIFATGEHECAGLPETSPWAEKYGAGPRVRMPDVVDDKPGYVHDTRRENASTPAWGRVARPGTAEVYVYPDARDGRVIADVLRKDKGHTEGLEPNITEALVKMMVTAPGGKARRA